MKRLHKITPRFTRVCLTLLLSVIVKTMTVAQCNLLADLSIQGGAYHCQGDSITVLNNSTVDPANTRVFYVWDWGDMTKKDTVLDKRTLKHAYVGDTTRCGASSTSRKSYNLTLYIYSTNDPLNCSHFQTSPIYVYKKPEASFSVPNAICIANPTVRFTNTSCPNSPASYKFNWEIKDLSTGTTDTTSVFSPNYTFTHIGDFQVTLIMTPLQQGTCGASIITQTLTVLPSAVAAATYSGSTCTPASIAFTNQSVGAVTSSWSVSPSGSATFAPSPNAPNPTIIFSQTGTFVVTLTITNPCGSKTWTTPITIIAAPSVKIAPITSFCAGNSATPRLATAVEGGTPTTYKWTFENGTPATFDGKVPPSVNWPNAGTFKVIVEATNACGSKKDTANVIVGDLAAIAVAKSTNTSLNCTPSTITFTNTSTGSPTVLWTISPTTGFTYKNSTTKNSKSPTIEFTQKGVYFVKMEMVNACGNNVWLDTITVKTAPSVILENITTSCFSNAFTPKILTEDNGGSPISRYSWTFSGATPPNFEGRTPPQIRFDSSGVLTLTVVNECDSFKITKNITVNQSIRVAVSRSALPTNNCGPFDVTFTNNSTGSTTYNWTITPPTNGQFQFVSSTATSKSPTIKFSKSGVYVVKLLMPNGCQDGIFMDTITVKTAPSVILENITTTCFSNTFTPKILTEDNGGSTISRYSWTFSGATPSSFEGKMPPQIRFDSSGVLTLTVVNECDSFKITKNITVNQSIRVAVSRSALPTNNCGPFDVTFTNNSTGSTTYNWTVMPPINGQFQFISSTATSKSPTIKFSKSGVYVVKVVMPNGCQDGIFMDTISVFTTPQISLQAVVGDCRPAVITPQATVLSDGGYPLSIAWVLAGGLPNAATTLNAGAIRYDSAGIFKQIIKISNLCGETTDSTMITVGDRANIVFATIPTAVCNVDAPFAVNISPVGGVLSGTGLTGQNVFNPSIAVVGANVLTYKIGAGRCQDSSKITINVYGTTVTAGRDTAVCGAVAQPFALNTGTPNGGNWSGPGVSNNVFSPSVSGIGRFVLAYSYRENVNNCVNTASKTVIVNTLPQMAFTAPPFGCKDMAIDFTNQTSGSTAQTWLFGDNTTSTLLNANHTFTQSGNYTVKLIAATGDNCRDSLSKTIFISKSPVAAFLPSNTEGCTDLKILLKNTAIDTATRYKWTFGNGQNSTLAQPDSLIFKNPSLNDSVFTIKLDATTQGCPSVTTTKTITVFPKPKADFGITADTICSNQTILFTNRAKGGATSFIWNLGNGTNFVGQTPPPQRYSTDTAVGIFTIKLNVESRCGKDSLKRNITVIPTNITAFFNLNTLRGCAPLTVDLTNFSTRGATVTYKISNGIDLLGGDTTVLRYTFRQAGTYTIVQYATRGCGYDSTIQTVTVLPTPPLIFAYQEKDKCNPLTVQFNNLSRDSLIGFQWTKNGMVFSSNTAAPLHRFDSAGVYKIVLTAKSPTNGCTASDSTTITVRLPLKLNVDSILPPLCADSTGAIIVQLQKITGGQLPFKFSLNDTIFTNTTGIFNNLAGQKNYTVHIRDANGCRDSQQLFMGGLPPIAVVLGVDRLIKLGDSVLVKATCNRPNIRYKWSPTEGVSCDTCETVWLRPFRETIYTVVAKDKAGCEAKARIKISVNGTGNVFLPNVFSPNRDGANDTFFPQTDASVKRINALTIYDRWGGVIFSRTNFDPNLSELGWDGGQAQSDVFVYKLDVEYLDGRRETLTGDVTLMR